VLRQTTLVKFEFRTNDDNRSTRVVDTLTQEILAEETTLALEVVRKRLERTSLGLVPRHTAVSDGVVYESIYSFLEDSFLVSQDNIWGVDFFKLLQTVVAIDHTAVEVIDI
jgi:hypothetical protein